jgi:hypothetical protein
MQKRTPGALVADSSISGLPFQQLLSEMLVVQREIRSSHAGGVVCLTLVLMEGSQF